MPYIAIGAHFLFAAAVGFYDSQMFFGDDGPQLFSATLAVLLLCTGILSRRHRRYLWFSVPWFLCALFVVSYSLHVNGRADIRAIEIARAAMAYEDENGRPVRSVYDLCPKYLMVCPEHRSIGHLVGPVWFYFSEDKKELVYPRYPSRTVHLKIDKSLSMKVLPAEQDDSPPKNGKESD